MTVQPIHWRDLPLLHRYRNRSVFLDTALVLTRGPLLVPGALVSYVAPTAGISTFVHRSRENKGAVVYGQYMHASGSPFAQLTFLSPSEALETQAIIELLESMVVYAGEAGALRLLAHVDEKNEAFEALRRSSFAVYTRQRVWKFSQKDTPVEDGVQNTTWRNATSLDGHAIRTLYNNVVPGLVQQVEPFSMKQNHKGMVFERKGEILAYVDLNYGSKGIWLQPFVHPDAEGVVEQFTPLVAALPNRRSRPVYVCIRSYQSWLEPSLEMMGARAGPGQAVMVKHLALVQKATQAVGMQVAELMRMEKGQPETTASITRNEKGNNPDSDKLFNEQRPKGVFE